MGLKQDTLTPGKVTADGAISFWDRRRSKAPVCGDGIQGCASLEVAQKFETRADQNKRRAWTLVALLIRVILHPRNLLPVDAAFEREFKNFLIACYE
jgi:hypothetical protein